jgi:uncharacterized protein (TIGR00369 family)
VSEVPTIGGVPMPPSAVMMGWRLIALDAAAGEMEVGFEGKPEFRNPAGYVQGGIISAMMDDAMGPLLVAHTQGRKYPSTIDLHTHFLRPVPVGPVTVKARVVRLGRQIAFLEAELYERSGKLAARSRASAALIEGIFGKGDRARAQHAADKESPHG